MFWSKIIIYSVRLLFVANAIYLASRQDLLLIGLLIGSLALTFIPELCEKFTHVKMTMSAKVIYIVFILCTQWLGTYLRFYDSLIWWDIMLHFSSGILLGYVGLMVLIWLDQENMLKERSRCRMIVFFTFLFSVVGAVFWEIIEFLSDTLVGSNTQLGSLRDTMEDMIFGTIGAALFSLYLIITYRYKRRSCLKNLVELNKTHTKDEQK